MHNSLVLWWGLGLVLGLGGIGFEFGARFTAGISIVVRVRTSASGMF